MQRLAGDEIVATTEGPLTTLSDLAAKRITTIEVRTKKMVIILTAKDFPLTQFFRPPLPLKNSVRFVTIGFKFSIDRDAPLAELLPTPLKTPAKLPHWTNEDLAKVPELTFGPPIAKSLPKEKVLELLAHRIAKINHLNRSKTDGFMLALMPAPEGRVNVSQASGVVPHDAVVAVSNVTALTPITPMGNVAASDAVAGASAVATRAAASVTIGYEMAPSKMAASRAATPGVAAAAATTAEPPPPPPPPEDPPEEPPVTPGVAPATEANQKLAPRHRR